MGLVWGHHCGAARNDSAADAVRPSFIHLPLLLPRAVAAVPVAGFPAAAVCCCHWLVEQVE